MQIHNYSYRIRGFSRLADYAIRWDMLSEKAKHKAWVLSFWAKHGLEATMEAFEVKGRTLYYWRQQLREGGGRLEALNEKSNTPRRRRKRTCSPLVLAPIRHLHTVHPNLSKEKLYIFVKPLCEREGLECSKPRTIGRIIADAPGKMRSFPVKARSNGQRVLRKKVAKVRKPKGFKSAYPGHCGAFDTVERFIEGYRRYVITSQIFTRDFLWPGRPRVMVL